MSDEKESKVGKEIHFHGQVGMAVIESKDIHDVNIQQIWNQINPNIEEFARALTSIKKQMEKQAQTPKQKESLANIEKAEGQLKMEIFLIL